MRTSEKQSLTLANERPGTSTASSYRPDIDGLRALAVSAVVLFHAGLSAIPGGYVGVDVFFVISGYLITRQVVSGVQRGGFSFVEFYTRRVRRLLPAALTTALLTLIVAWLIVPAFRLAEIAKSVAAAVLSVSNIFFWRETSYWADESAVQPLLHTWSLSVEEQFYLAWPFLLFFSLRWFKRATLPILVVGTFLSLAVTIWATHRSPDAAFYLTPFRTYEFALGALCVWVDRVPWRRSTMGRGFQSVSWLLGIGLILFAMITYDESGTAFPGWQALVPTVGAALVIAARRPAVFDRALDNPLMKYVGLRSYSLYLVHWPVLVFALEFVDSLTLVNASICIALTIGLAELQYRVIERPLRVHSTTSSGTERASSHRRRFMRMAAPVMAVALVIAGVSGATWAYASSPNVYAEEVRAVALTDKNAINSERRSALGDICAQGTKAAMCGALSDGSPNVLVIGDSYGVDGLNIAQVIAPDANYMVSEQVGCPPFHTERLGSECIALNEYRVPAIDRLVPETDLVVFSMKIAPENYEQTMDRVAELVKMGTPVAVIGQAAHYEQEAWQTVLEHGQISGVNEALFQQLDVTAEQNRQLKDDIESLGASYIDRWEWMCNSDSCRGFTESGADLVIFDTAHMTFAGATEFAEAVRNDPYVREVFAPAQGASH